MLWLCDKDNRLIGDNVVKCLNTLNALDNSARLEHFSLCIRPLSQIFLWTYNTLFDPKQNLSGSLSWQRVDPSHIWNGDKWRWRDRDSLLSDWTDALISGIWLAETRLPITHPLWWIAECLSDARIPIWWQVPVTAPTCHHVISWSAADFFRILMTFICPHQTGPCLNLELDGIVFNGPL